MDKETASRYVSEDAMAFIDSRTDMLNAPYFAMNGMEPVSISMEKVSVKMKVRPQDRNSNGFWHGGAIFGVMDHCFAILTNIDGHAVAQNNYINYYRPGRGDEIVAEAVFINKSKSLYSVEVRAYDGDKMVAAEVCNAFRLKEVHG